MGLRICRRCGAERRGKWLEKHEAGCFTSLEEFYEVFDSRFVRDETSACLFIRMQNGDLGTGRPQFLSSGKTMAVVLLEMKIGRPLLGTPWEVACHSCDVGHCVNPDHLWVGSQRQNLRDSIMKGRKPAAKPYVPTALGPRGGGHTRWHVNRGVLNPSCPLCCTSRTS